MAATRRQTKGGLKASGIIYLLIGIVCVVIGIITLIANSSYMIKGECLEMDDYLESGVYPVGEYVKMDVHSLLGKEPISTMYYGLTTTHSYQLKLRARKISKLSTRSWMRHGQAMTGTQQHHLRQPVSLRISQTVNSAVSIMISSMNSANTWE